MTMMSMTRLVMKKKPASVVLLLLGVMLLVIVSLVAAKPVNNIEEEATMSEDEIRAWREVLEHNFLFRTATAGRNAAPRLVE